MINIANIKVTEDLKNQIILKYKEQPITIKAMADIFNLSPPTIIKILKDIPKYAKADVFNPNINHEAFSCIDTELKAYFIGLLIADGNVYKDNKSGRQASISITLAKQDEYLLEAFRALVNTNTKTLYDKRKNSCAATVTVRSDKMAADLAKLGIVPRKTFSAYLPEIAPDLMPAVIRGILDGDGSIQAFQHNSRFLHYVAFCGTHALMEDISNYLDKTLDLKRKPKVYDYKNKPLSQISIRNYDDIQRFGELIYSDASIYMIRKKELYDKIILHRYGNTELTK